jgi:hypothetical protein
MSAKKDRRRRTAGTEKFEIAVFVGETVSVASAKVDGVIGVGEVKRVPGDTWSAQVGRDLAVGRALRDASDQLLERHSVKA